MILMTGRGRGMLSQGSKRSVFSLPGGMSATPRVAPILAQGPPPPPQADTASQERIRAAAADLLSALEAQYMKLVDEYALAEEQGAYMQIPIIGNSFSQGEVLTQMILVGGEIAGLALQTHRTADPYLTEEEVARIEEIQRGVQALINTTPAAMQEPILPEHRLLSDEHKSLYMAGPLALKGDLDRAIVETEARDIPVGVPETGTLALWIGGAAVATIALFAAFGD